MVRVIRVVPHDPRWHEMFQDEVASLRNILGDSAREVHHMGSTAIPGICAKPIIDVLVVVRDIAAIDGFDETMRARGYLPKGENGIPGRRYFVKGSEETHTHHVHIYQAGNPDIQRHLAFRDYLIAHPEEARGYGRLKEDLARRFATDGASYTRGKDVFVQAIDRKANRWNANRRVSSVANEECR